MIVFHLPGSAPDLGEPYDSFTVAELPDLPPRPPEPATRPTWAELVQVEPRLADVERLAFRLHWHHAGDMYWHWYNDLKDAFLGLVGWGAEQYDLRTAAAYDVAYDHLFYIFWHGRRPATHGVAAEFISRHG